MKTTTLIVALAVTISAAYAQETESLWKCTNPDRPFRYATSDSSKNKQTPPCVDWTQLRGIQLAALLESLGSEKFSAANEFVAKALETWAVTYPTNDLGHPVLSSQLYANPMRFGFKTVEIQDAPLGSIVVYDGLAGILVEVERPGDTTWTRKVLYPSAAREFELRISDLDIPGKQPAKVMSYSHEPPMYGD